MNETLAEQARQFRENFQRLLQEIGRCIVGHRQIVEHMLLAFFAGGHVLLEGVPGVGKTLLARTLAQVLSLPFSRIQFTPDLMPSDIIGTTILVEDESGRRSFRFQKGPVFAGIVLADEINRATPKTQSALLECMQENQVTVSGNVYPLENPFFVIGTQNPIEMEGTYPLPEAQLDRFSFKLGMESPARQELNDILQLTCAPRHSVPLLKKILDRRQTVSAMELIREVYIAPDVQDYVARLVLATHPGSKDAPEEITRYVRYGVSPRGGQAMVLSAKVRALCEGRYNVSFADVAGLVKPALRHRILLNFEGESEGVTTEGLIDKIVAAVPTVATGAG